MSNPFSDPEAADLLKNLLLGLTEESHRGAVLIGAAYVDNCLRSLFEASFPSALSAKRRKELLSYPGVLSSFASRIEVAYTSRLISREAYDSLHALRRLRNDVAHTPDTFTLVGQEDRYKPIFAFGPNVPDGVRRVAFNMMLEMKTAAVIEAIQSFRAKDPQVAELIRNKEEATEFIKKHPDILEVLEHQLPQWELAIGLALLCSLLIQCRKTAVAALGADKTVGELGSSPPPSGTA